MSKPRIYKCPLCGFEGRKSNVVHHMYVDHEQYMLDKCEEHEIPTTGENIKCIALCLTFGLLDFKFCPNCGAPFLNMNYDFRISPVRMNCKCGYNHRTEVWSKSMREWLDSPNASEHRNQCRELGKAYGPINGPKNYADYNRNLPDEERKRRSLNGKKVGPKNLFNYNHDVKYAEVRQERLKASIAKRESNEQYLIDRAKRSELSTQKRATGIAQLYIIVCTELARGQKCVKVGYSRNFEKFRKSAYSELFNIEEEYVFTMEASRVLEFESHCIRTFNHYFPKKYSHNIGRSEWYWFSEFDKIKEYAKEFGLDI